MKNAHFLLFIFALFTMSGCSVIGDIFKAGAVTGIIAVIIVIAIIIWVISLFRGKS
ncbi:phosphatidate cytidylyltransferase [Mucilaginibacter sp. 3215]|uniref:phosphatidate cytidylyltransferase n=1 Tax=Mucilaginibacter sp. 3215 TaxID=3373912 RepID=UPI003D1A535B